MTKLWYCDTTQGHCDRTRTLVFRNYKTSSCAAKKLR